MISAERDARKARLVLGGELDMDARFQAEQALDDLLSTPVEQLVVDLGEVTFVDSTGMGLVLEVHDRARSRASVCGCCAGRTRSSGSSSSPAWQTYYRSPDGEALCPHLRPRARRGEVRRLLRGARLRAARQAAVRDRLQRLHGPPRRRRHARADGQHRPRGAVRPRRRLQPHRAHGRRPRRAARGAGEDRRRAREAAVRPGRARGGRADLLRPGPGRLPHRADRRRRVQDARKTPERAVVPPIAAQVGHDAARCGSSASGA